MWLAESLRSKSLIESRQGWTRSQLLEHQQRSLRDLLHRVWKDSPFYREYYGNHGIQEKDLSDITVRDLPILDKETLMDGFDRISTDPVLRRNRLEAWLHSESRNPYEGRYMVVHTSGSSGNMGIFVYDKEAWGRTRGICLLYTSPSPRDQRGSRMPSSA